MTPYELNDRYTALFNAGDLDGLTALYEPGAAFSGAHGEEAIRARLGELLARTPVFETEVRRITEAGDLALLVTGWRFTAGGETGTGTSVEVARRQGDGSWRYVIDEPRPMG
ncbi:YybH family protein [Nonomuraea sp. NPDC050556]|uniref:YybH family protein n=1 Tax=Nonomuraea sp. NPDC050556 TaxID=3364369 RepID=UPI0037A15233